MCIVNLNMVIAEDEILNSKVSHIHLNKIRCNGAVRPKANFLDILKQFQVATIQLDGDTMLTCSTMVKASQAKRNISCSQRDFNMHASNPTLIETDSDVPDSDPNQTTSIYLEHCDNISMILSYAAHQQ